MTAALQDNNIDISTIQALFVTHEHIDHVRGVRVFANKHHIPVYSSEGTLRAMIDGGYVDEKTDCRIIPAQGVNLDTMHIDAFRTSHDCAESNGFAVTMNDAKFALATDLGYVSQEVENALLGADAVVIESNHDVRMLQAGSYPYLLKRRILSDKGHLSNKTCAELLPKLIQSGVTRLILAHLSKENNMPEIALAESVNELAAHHMKENEDYTICTAPVASTGMAVVF